MANGVQVPLLQERVREELDRVLGSHEFRASKRSQDFLRYVVEHALAGQASVLKERTIGIDVFGRPASYDPSDDATVRVKAGEVRKRLGLYYSGVGAPDPVRIEFPPGTYVPEFHFAPPPPPPRCRPFRENPPALAPAACRCARRPGGGRGPDLVFHPSALHRPRSILGAGGRRQVSRSGLRRFRPGLES